jgi:hypothetical protein
VDTPTTFTDRREFERAAALLNGLSIEHLLNSPEPAYAHVGCPAVALTDEATAPFLEAGRIDIVSSGWVDFRRLAQAVPAHLAGDVAEAPPCLNAKLPQGSHIAKLPFSPLWTAIAWCHRCPRRKPDRGDEAPRVLPRRRGVLASLTLIALVAVPAQSVVEEGPVHLHHGHKAESGD